MHAFALPLPPEDDRATELLEAVREANARRMAEAQARAAAIVAEAEAINARFLALAEEQVDMLLRFPFPLGGPVDERATGAREAAEHGRATGAPKGAEHEEVAAVASIDGGVDLVAGPFTRFSQLASFTRRVRDLPGVSTLDARQFLKGTVHLRLRYADPIPLSVRLAQLDEFAPTVLTDAPHRVELRVHIAERPAEDDQSDI